MMNENIIVGWYLVKPDGDIHFNLGHVTFFSCFS